MGGLAVRSVILSESTTQAWKDAGVSFARRGRPVWAVLDMARDYEFLLNLGKSEFNNVGGVVPARKVWNEGRNILPLLYPGFTRQLLGDMMPPQPTEWPAEVWIKAPGMKGKGKYLKTIDRGLTLPAQWDWQVHVVGTEYRVITVGSRVVQSFIKTGTATEREYEWVGTGGTPDEVKRLARAASAKLTGQNVVGWDMVFGVNQPPYIFEGNSCPGMNDMTASRVVREIYRQMEERA